MYVIASFFTLIGLAIAVLPIVALLRQIGFTRRLGTLERELDEQRRTIDDLRRRLARAERPEVGQVVPPAASSPSAQAPPARPVAPEPPRDRSVQALTPAAPRPAAAPPGALPPMIAPPPPPTASPRQPAANVPAAPPEIPARPAWTPPWAGFDWEQLVGVKLFSAIAGVALVLAAIFFFRYSLDRGWLAPTVRVAIGVVVAVALLLVCELRAAQRYRVTANALDAAAIAILFATFFAAHTLWGLIPSTPTFGLLILVAVVAVLLSIRRDSIFIAVLGLAGGFATPALLSTGENRPIPLFTYLLLLNIGLAWVAVRKKWPSLTVLTLVLTTLYQWGWVIRFLSASDLTLGMGIFLVFAVTSFAALTLARQGAPGSAMTAALEQSGLAASAMPLLFAVFLSAVPEYGARPGLLFGFLLIVVLGIAAVAIARRNGVLHAMGGVATLLVFGVWLATSYAAGSWQTVAAFTVAFAAVFAAAPFVADRLRQPLPDVGSKASYVAPILLFTIAVIVRIEPQTEAPLTIFAAAFVILAIVVWRAFTAWDAGLYFAAAFFALAAEASWSATHFSPARLWTAVALYAAFAVFYLGVPLAWRRLGRVMEPTWGSGAVLLASLAMLLFLAAGPRASGALWGLALLLAILDAGLFIEGAAGRTPVLTMAGGLLSWFVLAVWWRNAGTAVGVLPSLLVIVGLTMIMFAGHAWAARQAAPEDGGQTSFRRGIYLGLVGHLFLSYAAQDAHWALPPWPLLGALLVMTLAATAGSLNARTPHLHAAGTVAAAMVVLALAMNVPTVWALTALAAMEAVVAYAAGSLFAGQFARSSPTVRAIGAITTAFVAELGVMAAAAVGADSILPVATLAHVANISLILWLTWQQRWTWVGMAAVAPAWLATAAWQWDHTAPGEWRGTLALAAVLYALFAAYPLILHRRALKDRGPYLTAILGAVFFFFEARQALLDGQLRSVVGGVPVVEGIVLAFTLRQLLRLEPAGQRDLGRLALVAASALGFATVAIPVQLTNQWVTIGWALEAAALAWLYLRVPHKGLLYGASALMAIVFVRLVLNPAVFVYEPRGSERLLNWYLYAYVTCAVAMFAAARWLQSTDDRIIVGAPRISTLLTPAGVIVLFLLLNIEVADFFATGPEITFRFGAGVAQDLTYTLAWLVFGMAMLAVGIFANNRYGRIAALALIAVTTSKAFLYDLGSLGGLYRVGSLVGLAASLALVALALQRFVLLTPKERT